MHTKRISITLYMANAKVTKHPRFLPMKHENKNRELKAAERTRTGCSHSLHHFTDGLMRPATSRCALDACLQMPTPHHQTS